MNDDWSQFEQTSEELWRSRALRFHEGNQALWLDALGVRDGMDVLEVGCGSGIFCHRIRQFMPGARVTGLDFDTGHIAYAQAKNAELGLDCQLVCGDATDLPFPGNSFDLCFSHTVMEHIPTVPFLAEQRRVLRPGGRIVAFSVRMGLSMPDVDGAEEEERALLRRLWQAAEGRSPRKNVGAYGAAESDYPKALETAGFRDVAVRFFAVEYCAPDSADTPPPLAREQIEVARLHCLASVTKSLRLAPGALTDAEVRRARDLINGRFDWRQDQYARGEKVWDLTARMVLAASGRKPEAIHS
ncbi:MAG: class I SAM-dependent methyltransferase [Oscillospiraceae bacterium]|jgi:SAM-dependent methyltransferase|nr:class I SAM-dependent methyltransferase [Oscillospiraceae bacterium]